MSLKILVVSYLPSTEHSSTKKLLDAFLGEVKKGDVVLETLDLTKDVPDLFVPERLTAYVTRNYMGKALSPELKKAITGMDQMTAQLKKADAVVLATPMHNFSLPAIVKGYFDAVMQKGETWDLGPAGYVGLMRGKRALVLGSSGGAYEGDLAKNDHAFSLAKFEFEFMGFGPVQLVTAQGLGLYADRKAAIIAEAAEAARKVALEWARA